MKVNIGKPKMMTSGSEGEVLKSKIDPCGVYGNRVMLNSVLCKKCGKWIHGRCAKMKRVTTSLAQGFVCVMCRKIAEGRVKPVEELCDGVESVNRFCYLGDRLNASDRCEVAVTARARLGWVKFRECGELLRGKRLSLELMDMLGLKETVDGLARANRVR